MFTCAVCHEESNEQTREYLRCQTETNTEVYVDASCTTPTICCGRVPRYNVRENPEGATKPPNLLLAWSAARKPQFSHRTCPT
jgi:hypothetical protein